MANFQAFTLTRAGRKILAQGQTGLPIRFVRVAAGDGEAPPGTAIDDLTGLIHPVKDLPINGNTIIGDGTTQIDCVLSNRGLNEMLELREVGVFAIDNDNGLETLYAYTVAEPPDYIPADSGPNAVELLLSIITIIKQAANVTVEITEGYGFVTPAQMEDRISDLFRPSVSEIAHIWTADATEPWKLRPAAIQALREALFSDMGIQESSLLGYDPITDTVFGYPMDRLIIRALRSRGGNPAMQIADYPDGTEDGGNPTMALADYPDSPVSGGDPFTF